MKRKYLIVAATAVITVGIIRLAMFFLHTDYSQKNITVGFVYIGDSGTPYTNNFVRSQVELEKAFPNNVTTIAKYNIPEDNCEPAIRDLILNGCSLIFGTSLIFSRWSNFRRNAVILSHSMANSLASLK